MPRTTNPNAASDARAVPRQANTRGSASIPSHDSLGWQEAWTKSAREALKNRRILSAEEREAPALNAVDTDEQSTLAANKGSHEPMVPGSECRVEGFGPKPLALHPKPYT